MPEPGNDRMLLDEDLPGETLTDDQLRRHLEEERQRSADEEAALGDVEPADDEPGEQHPELDHAPPDAERHDEFDPVPPDA